MLSHPHDGIRSCWLIATGHVWPDGVVVTTAAFDQNTRFQQCVEQSTFSSSSRSFPLNDSMCPFSHGLPGSINSVFTPTHISHSRMCRAVNSELLSLRTHI